MVCWLHAVCGIASICCLTVLPWTMTQLTEPQLTLGFIEVRESHIVILIPHPSNNTWRSARESRALHGAALQSASDSRMCGASLRRREGCSARPGRLSAGRVPVLGLDVPLREVPRPLGLARGGLGGPRWRPLSAAAVLQTRRDHPHLRIRRRCA